jgi:flagellar M-ring protein FliF
VEKGLTPTERHRTLVQIISNLRHLGRPKLAALAGVLVLTVSLLAWLAASMTSPRMALLYGGLEPSVAGEVVRKLEEMKVAYEVQGDAILVAVDERDRVRMTLAEAGVPRQGQAGYELLDQLGRFGTTTDMFNAAYWRAKEGELARTIDSLSNVREARVHLVPLSREPFSRTPADPSASITVTTEDGAPLSRRQAQAIRHLVALGVKGLQPQKVTVIDAAAGIVLGPDSAGDALPGEGAHAEREQRLQAEIEEMLAAHVGHDRLRVTVALELDREAESVTERSFDPSTQVAIHTDTTEIEETSSDSEGADAVSVAGNLPGADAGAAGMDSSRSARTETREVANYEVSEVRRERQKLAGSTKRISVAVLVGGTWEEMPDGQQTWRPQSEAELAAIQSLVQSAVGFKAERGDVVTVQSLPFRAHPGSGADDVAPGLGSLILAQLGTLAQALALVTVMFLAMWFIARPVVAEWRSQKPSPALTHAVVAPGSAQEVAAFQRNGEPARLEAEAPRGHLPQAEPSPHEQAVLALIEAVDRHPEEALYTLRRWLGADAAEEART